LEWAREKAIQKIGNVKPDCEFRSAFCHDRWCLSHARQLFGQCILIGSQVGDSQNQRGLMTLVTTNERYRSVLHIKTTRLEGGEVAICSESCFIYSTVVASGYLYIFCELSLCRIYFPTRSIKKVVQDNSFQQGLIFLLLVTIEFF
jgi:hypothetical protein